MTWEPELQELQRRSTFAEAMGGPKRIADQRERGKLTIRERIDLLFDPDTFMERGKHAGTGAYDEDGNLVDFFPSAYITGIGEVDGRPVVTGGGDFTARPPSGSEGARVNTGRAVPKSGHDERTALEMKIPLVRLIDGFGADIRGTAGIGRTYIPELRGWPLAAALMSEVPVVSMSLGAVAGLPAAQVAIAHFAIMVDGISQVFAAGPPVVERSLGQKVTKEELGGVKIHAHQSGLVDNVAKDEADAFQQVRRFLSYLPSSVYQLPPVQPSDDPIERREEALLSIVPRERNRPQNTRRMLNLILDDGSLFEIGRFFGPSQFTGFGRLDGHPVGVLAGDPMHSGGATDAASAQKLESFIDLCDTFHLPIVNFADNPGFMIGPQAEASGTLRLGARALCAMDASTIPWATVIVRKAYGVAGAAHQPYNRYVYRIAWPSGEWGSIPIEGGVQAAYRREIESAEDPKRRRGEIETELIALRSPFGALEAFNAEDIIDPRDTRKLLCKWVKMAYAKLPADLGRKTRPMRP